MASKNKKQPSKKSVSKKTAPKTKPTVKKQAPPKKKKKMAPKQQATRAKQDADAIVNSKPAKSNVKAGKKITKTVLGKKQETVKIQDVQPVVTEQPAATVVNDVPHVFLDNHRRVYLLLREGTQYNHYVSTRDGELSIVKLTRAAPPRDKDGRLPEATTSIADLIPHNGYDLKKAAQRLYTSLLVRTEVAERELCNILGITPQSNPQRSNTMASTKKAAKAAKSAAANDSKYVVKNTSTVKRGFLKDFVEQASKLKQFTLDALTAKVKGKECNEDRARRYFYYCTAHGIFAQAK